MGAGGSIINTNDEDILKQAREIYNTDPDRFERLVKEVREAHSNDEKEVVEDKEENVDSETEISGDGTSRERRVIEEMNFVRTNPHEYAARLEKVASQFKGVNRHVGSNFVIKTKEGASAVLECAKELRSLTKPLPKLSLNMPKGMTEAARDHVDDTGPKSIIGHIGSDSSTPVSRLERHGTWIGKCGENISYGWDDPEMIVMQLMIDDDVPDRGHRRTILDGAFRVCGVAIGGHKKYGKMCVITYAADYTKKMKSKSGAVEASDGSLTEEMKNVLNSLPVRDRLKPKVEKLLKQGAKVTLKYTAKSVEMTALFSSGSKSVMKASW